MATVTSDEVLAELNRVRANPSAYSAKLAKLVKNFHGLIYHGEDGIDLETNEGAAVVQEAVKELKGTKPLSPFVLSEGLTVAAQEHCDDCGPAGVVGHDGTNGSTMDSRITEHGEWIGGIGEIISYGSTTVEGIIAQFLVDDGNESRGHRRNILNPDFHVVGIGCGPHSTEGYMCTVCFASAYQEAGGLWLGQPPISRCPPMKARGHEPVIRSAEDEEWPEGATGMRRSAEITETGHKRITTVTKEFTMQDGSKQTQIETIEEDI